MKKKKRKEISEQIRKEGKEVAEQMKSNAKKSRIRMIKDKLKRLLSSGLALILVITVTACGGGPSGGGSYVPVDSVFPRTDVYYYTGGANVPLYKIDPDLSNIVNINQFSYGTDEQGDYYFAEDLQTWGPGARDYIADNGFVVLDYRNYPEYYSVYEDNRYNYVPSFITTDSVLHTFHLMYDYILKDLERSTLMGALRDLSEDMVNTSYEQYKSLKGSKFENAAFRNVAFFTVGGKLLDKSFPVKNEVKDLVNAEISLIEKAQGISESPLVNYGQNYKDPLDFYKIDYSQFKPRAHYTQSEELKDYFKSSMWYGQVTMRAAYEDELRSSLLMASALLNDNNIDNWNIIFQTINFFVGECDDITAVDYYENLSDIYEGGLGNLGSVKDEKKLKEASAIVAKMPGPAINSIPVYEEDIQEDIESAIKGFRFMGQRFTIDGAIFQKLMDRQTRDRMLPNALDIPAAFGSDEAYNILEGEFQTGNYPDYHDNLQDIRGYMETVSDKIWTSNLYWSWLNTLRPLADNKDREGYPLFMQSRAWLRKELNTFLGSWTELKHDTLLYAKQPMAEMGGGWDEEAPTPPDDRGYVEPNPEVYGRLALLIWQTKEGLNQAGLMTKDVESALEKLQEIAGTLTDIAEKELQNKSLVKADYDFIRNYGAELEHIWDTAKQDELAEMEKEYGYADKRNYLSEHPDAVVADVATDPNGRVLEEATGYAKPIIVAFPRDGEVVLARGVVYSHYEFTVDLDKRMTDEEWHQRLRYGDTPDEGLWTIAFTHYYWAGD